MRMRKRRSSSDTTHHAGIRREILVIFDIGKRNRRRRGRSISTVLEVERRRSLVVRLEQLSSLSAVRRRCASTHDQIKTLRENRLKNLLGDPHSYIYHRPYKMHGTTEPNTQFPSYFDIPTPLSL